MRPRMAHLLVSLALAAGCLLAVAGVSAARAQVGATSAKVATPRPTLSARLPATAAAQARPLLAVTVRDAPRGARVLVQERTRGRWRAAGDDDGARVRGDRRLTLRWRGLRSRDAVQLRIALLDRRDRTLDATDSRTVLLRSDEPLVLAADALRLHSLGADRWDVWTCGAVAGGDAAAAAEVLEERVAPFYAWLSNGRYEQRFRARGALDGDDLSACASEAARASAGRDGALIVQQLDRISAGADACLGDATRLDPCAGQPTVLPGNERIAWLGPGQLFGADAHISTVVHELGHTLGWPHSFTGRLRIEREGAEVGVEYDDPLDVMGYERLWGTGGWDDPGAGTFTPKATQAFNRIAAGWVPDTATTVHDRPSATYSVGPLDGDGLQVVIVPTADARAFLTLEVRVQRPFDPLPGEGVVVHAIDQRPAACDPDEEAVGCWGDQLRASPAPNTPESLDSLVTVGEQVDVAGVRIAVGGRVGDRFTVTVDGARARFEPLKPTLCLYVPDACVGGLQGPL
ncbi:hypothetical protein VSS74_21390 [Conexibacter stalactiti]|uniref:Peptidase M11 gametolysin domain-containing protein n=1 Tax=Conexibacter stalactiti TaxID=1940611 RepID=A0ABU4HUC9_9ACTN|nr:hypothetical protein [Conexibacter stalactiti]MDW5596916.1 hypothetical protein [Conexibacter stalactiti]MEC5037558.1 hypothetical protein [Conexibacter stalactiti]